MIVNKPFPSATGMLLSYVPNSTDNDQVENQSKNRLLYSPGLHFPASGVPTIVIIVGFVEPVYG